MQVNFTPEQEAQIAKIAASVGTDPEAIVKDATMRLLDEDARFRAAVMEGKAYADRLERSGVKVRYTCHEAMIHHFYGMAGAIPYAHTAMKTAGAAIKTALA